MFYEGDLQSGIALAIQQVKRVVCFVRDDGDESRTWENEYLADPQISHLLASNAVALRLQSGSQEAGFLSSVCPINKVPTLVVINNGALQEYIVSGTNGEEVKRRLTVALGGEGIGASAQQGEQQREEERPAPTPSAEPRLPTQSEPVGLSATSSPLGQEQADASEQSRRQSIREGKRRAENIDEQSGDRAQTSQQDWKNQQRKREQQEKQERERVLALIRHDNEERRAKEMRKKMPRLPRDAIAHVPDTPPPEKRSQFRILVRLFDGTSIRSSFSPTQTIRRDVRPWIDRERTDGDTPYTLKHILTPLPNKNISVAEEDQELSELELGPTASFVMVPVRTYTEAYTSTSSLPVRALYGGYSLITGTIGAVAGGIGSLLGFGGGQPSQTPQSASHTATPDAASTGNTPRRNNTPMPRTAGSNVRTLHDHRNEQPQQFYNGNQLNFEPRKEQDQDS